MRTKTFKLAAILFAFLFVLSIAPLAMAEEGAGGTTSEKPAKPAKLKPNEKALKEAVKKLKVCYEKFCGEGQAKLEEALSKLREEAEKIKSLYNSGDKEGACKELKKFKHAGLKKRIHNAIQSYKNCKTLYLNTKKKVENFLQNHPDAKEKFAEEIAFLQEIDQKVQACHDRLKGMADELKKIREDLKPIIQECKPAKTGKKGK